MIQTRSEISVDPRGKWFYRDAEITHPEVLKYFKQNLFRTDRYYIVNVFGELREEGDLDRVLEAPIFAVSATYTQDAFDFLLDSEERITVNFQEILVSGSECLFFLHPRGIPVRLKTSAMTHVSEYLTGPDEAPIWKNGEPLKTGDMGQFLQP